MTGDFFIVFVVMGATGAYAGICWLVAASAPAISAALRSTDAALTTPVSVAILFVPAAYALAAIANFFWSMP